jgi:predicted membrane protein
MERLEQRRELNNCSTPGRHLFSGMVFLAIGVVFLLGNMGLLNVGSVLRFWPVILIAVGIFKLVESGENYAHSSGIFWIVIGGLFLTGTLGILRVSFRDLWPVVLIGFGAWMLWRSVHFDRERRRAASARRAGNTDAGSGFTTGDESEATKTDSQARSNGSAGVSSDAIISALAILGAVERRNNSQDFRGGSITAIMGGCEIDLRGASITSPNDPVLEVFALWGGVELRVPPDWTVVSRVDPILGGYEDSTLPPKEGSKRIVLRGTAIMGGIEVTN